MGSQERELAISPAALAAIMDYLLDPENSLVRALRRSLAIVLAPATVDFVYWVARAASYGRP
ncbi:MAG: hypothetical protein M1401_13115 [Chloroflexi bacterium]|nr:hypothetical protein [Chloroflexota bacterium]